MVRKEYGDNRENKARIRKTEMKKQNPVISKNCINCGCQANHTTPQRSLTSYWVGSISIWWVAEYGSVRMIDKQKYPKERGGEAVHEKERILKDARKETRCVGTLKHRRCQSVKQNLVSPRTSYL